MDEESTKRIVISDGITNTWMRNPPREWSYLMELPTHG
jgi:hypothetical protein